MSGQEVRRIGTQNFPIIQEKLRRHKNLPLTVKRLPDKMPKPQMRLLFVSSSFLWLFIRENNPNYGCGAAASKTASLWVYGQRHGAGLCFCGLTSRNIIKERSCFAPRVEKLKSAAH